MDGEALKELEMLLLGLEEMLGLIDALAELEILAD